MTTTDRLNAIESMLADHKGLLECGCQWSSDGKVRVGTCTRHLQVALGHHALTP